MPTARKTKKKIKGIQQAAPGVAQETPENPANKTVVPAALPQVSPTLVSLLEVIEPEVLFAGYDSSLPDSTWRIMTTLNMLGGRQVIAAVKWAKALPGKMKKMTQLRCKPLYFPFCTSCHDHYDMSSSIRHHTEVLKGIIDSSLCCTSHPRDLLIL